MCFDVHNKSCNIGRAPDVVTCDTILLTDPSCKFIFFEFNQEPLQFAKSPLLTKFS